MVNELSKTEVNITAAKMQNNRTLGPHGTLVDAWVFLGRIQIDLLTC